MNPDVEAWALVLFGAAMIAGLGLGYYGGFVLGLWASSDGLRAARRVIAEAKRLKGRT